MTELGARLVERVAEEVGHQVEQWLATEQQRSLQTLRTPAPAPASQAKFYISFDGTGVPMRKNELVGRRGKQADGARTRRCLLGWKQTPKRASSLDSKTTTSVCRVGSGEKFSIFLPTIAEVAVRPLPFGSIRAKAWNSSQIYEENP